MDGLTRYAVHDTESGSLVFILIDHAFLGRLRDGNGQRDGGVEPAASWFQGHDGTDCHAVSKELRHKLWGDRLSLLFKVEENIYQKLTVFPIFKHLHSVITSISLTFKSDILIEWMNFFFHDGQR